MENATNDFDGPWLVRDLLATRLSQRGYAILPSADVDRLLKEQGFTDGGQLKRVEPKQLGEWLGVDAVFYSTLLDFSYVNLGFYTHRKVKVESHLVDVKTGEKLWGAERTWFTFNVETDKEKAGTNFAVQLVTQAVERWAKVPLKAEAEWAVDLLLQTLPYR